MLEEITLHKNLATFFLTLEFKDGKKRIALFDLKADKGTIAFQLEYLAKELRRDEDE